MTERRRRKRVTYRGVVVTGILFLEKRVARSINRGDDRRGDFQLSLANSIKIFHKTVVRVRQRFPDGPSDHRPTNRTMDDNNNIKPARSYRAENELYICYGRAKLLLSLLNLLAIVFILCTSYMYFIF